MMNMSRRNFLKGAAVSALGMAAMSKLDITVAKAEETAVVNTEVVMPEFATIESGKIVGYKFDGVYRFMGVPYGTAKRFEQAKPVEPWEGVMTTFTEGYVAPQQKTTINNYEFTTFSHADMVESEDCLNLNVWTMAMDSSAKRPVIVFLHGGGSTTGSSNELTTYDGANLTKFGDIVFVSVNHRLGQLAFLDMSAYGEQFKYSGNLLTMDCVRALEWVRDNIEVFGGDPNNVTIYGQSGGGGKVASLMCTDYARGLFHKAVMASGGGIGVTGVARADAQAKTQELVDSLGLTGKSNEEIVAALTEMHWDDLMTACKAVGAGSNYVTEGDVRKEKEENILISADIPLMTTKVITEFIGNGVNITGPRLMSEEDFKSYMFGTYTEDEVKMKLTEKYGESTEAIIAAYQEAYPGHDLYELLFLISRNNSVALDKAAQGAAPVYQAVYAWTYPMFGGMTNAHTQGDFPLVFHTLDRVAWQIAGNEVEAYKLADICSQALVNFMKNGDPSQEGLEWPAFTAEGGETMIFDTVSGVRGYHDQKLMDLIAAATAK